MMKLFLLVVSTEQHRERSTASREMMASQTYSTMSVEKQEAEQGRGGLCATMMQPVVKLYRIGMYCNLTFTKLLLFQD